MLRKKPLFACLSSAVLMFSLSYGWHGVVLNDFRKINYPIEVFLLFLAILYLLLGFIMALGLSYIPGKKHSLYSGLGLGIVSGLVIFLIVFVLGTSFSGKELQPLHASIDFIWQIVEQSLGGLCAAKVYFSMEKREMMFK